jgi:hypothetical protein
MENIPQQINENELRDQQAEKIVNFLTKIGAHEYAQKLLSHPEEKNDFTFEKFKDFLVRINGIARDISISERKADGETVYLSGFDEALVPQHADKESILQDAYSALYKVSSGDSAYMLPAVINAVHLFADGNGRTSRIMHTLLEKDQSAEDFTKKLRRAVEQDGRRTSEDINPAIVRTDVDKIILTRHGTRFENEKDWSPVFPDSFGLLFASSEGVISPATKKFMEIRRTDQPYCFIAAQEYLQEQNKLSENVREVQGGIALSPAQMDRNLTETDWDEIMKRYYALKKEHVEILIDAFVQPDVYKNLDGSMNLKDYFIDQIRKRLQENQEQ